MNAVGRVGPGAWEPNEKPFIPPYPQLGLLEAGASGTGSPKAKGLKLGHSPHTRNGGQMPGKTLPLFQLEGKSRRASSHPHSGWVGGESLLCEFHAGGAEQGR